MGQAGFRTDWERGTRDILPFKATSTARLPERRPPMHCIRHRSQVTVDANAQLTGGNLLARWKRVVNDRSDFQVQAYFDRTNHFEPEFGETRDTFDIDFLHHLILPGQQNFLWGVGARVSPSNIVQLSRRLISSRAPLLTTSTVRSCKTRFRSLTTSSR